jgi:hypothetical protein
MFELTDLAMDFVGLRGELSEATDDHPALLCEVFEALLKGCNRLLGRGLLGASTDAVIVFHNVTPGR